MKDITPEVFLTAVEAIAGDFENAENPSYDFEDWLEVSGLTDRLPAEKILVMKCPRCRRFTHFDGTSEARCHACDYENLYAFSELAITLARYYAIMLEDENYCFSLFENRHRSY